MLKIIYTLKLQNFNFNKITDQQNQNQTKKNISNILILNILVIILTQITITNQSTISSMDSKSSCLYTFSDNTSVDLSPLRKEKDYIFPVGRYIYKGNFCGPQVDKCSGLNLPASIYIRRKQNRYKIKKF